MSPARSRAQQRYMAMLEHDPGAVRGPKPDLTHQQLHDFAATKTKNLPEHVRPAKRASSMHPHKNLGAYLHPKKGR
jgi:hypothetical protein